MKSADLKAEILAWLRYVRKQEIICTEAGPYKADCWGLSPKRLIEVETKVTYADLVADLKKRKHYVYHRAGYIHGVPNLFYFAVPPNLVAAAEQFLKEQAGFESVSKYGLIVVKKLEGYLGRQTDIVIEAKRLTTEPPSAAVVRTATLRMGSELCGLHAAHRKLARVVGLPLADAGAELANAAQLMYREAELLLEQRGEEDGTAIPD